MRKTVLLFLLVALPGVVTAASITATSQPGETTVLDASVTQDNTSVEIESSSLPTDLNLAVNDTNLTASPSYNLFPGNYTGKVTFSNNYNQTYQVEVPETFNWTLTPEELNNTISVGTSGQTSTTQIGLESNIDPEFSGEITGNISEHFSVDRFQFEEAGRYTVVLGYGVNENTQFGNYTGKLVVEDIQGEDQTVNLSYRFEDNIPPEITGTHVDDVMSTKEADFSLAVSDNLNVSQVCAEIYREEEIGKGNTTVIENRTLDDSPYCFEHESDTSLWELGFDDTENRGQYHMDIKANDTSGNAVEQTESFTVESLNVINALETDFRFDDMRPRTDDSPERAVEGEILELEKSTPVELSLSELSHRKENSSLTIGVREQSEENIQKLYSEDGKQAVEIEERGKYILEVYSDSQGDTYDGTISIDHVPQHTNVSNIQFSGTVVDPEFPVLPENKSLGDFEGSMQFILNDNDVPVGIEYEARQLDIENCKNVESWSNCMPGYTLGEIDEVKDEISTVKRNNAILLWFGTLVPLSSLGFLGMFIRRQIAKGRIVAVKPVKLEHFDEEFSEEELREFGVE